MTGLARPKAAGAAPCPICGRPARAETLPFCSPRCADVDLGRWLGEHYAIPGPPDEYDDAEPTRERHGEAGQG